MLLKQEQEEFLSFLVSLLFALVDKNFEILVCFIFAMVSLIDDKFNISSLLRYISQIYGCPIIIANSFL